MDNAIHISVVHTLNAKYSMMKTNKHRKYVVFNGHDDIHISVVHTLNAKYSMMKKNKHMKYVVFNGQWYSRFGCSHVKRQILHAENI